MRNVFLNFHSRNNTWKLDTIASIISKVQKYCTDRGLTDVELNTVEDNTESDPDNNRYDVEIVFVKDGHQCWQKLLVLKGEVIDGYEFHKRYEEFYKGRNRHG